MWMSVSLCYAPTTCSSSHFDLIDLHKFKFFISMLQASNWIWIEYSDGKVFKWIRMTRILVEFVIFLVVFRLSPFPYFGNFWSWDQKNQISRRSWDFFKFNVKLLIRKLVSYRSITLQIFLVLIKALESGSDIAKVFAVLVPHE